MNLLSEREQDVLELIIRDYIVSALPISSERVREISDRDMSSATFRTIMSNLEETGYLTKPHMSAGRVPTQKGYRFFVDSCISYQNLEKHSEQSEQSYDDPQELIHYIVSQTGLLGVYVHPHHNIYVQFGMGEALRAPEFSESDRVQAFGDFVDTVQEISDIYHSMLIQQKKTQAIFIERENPVPEARSLSVAVSQNRDEGTIFVVGPSRMDYERVLRALHFL